MSIGGATLVGGAHKNLINTSAAQVLDLIDTGRFPATCADFAKKGCTLREAPLPGLTTNLAQTPGWMAERSKALV